MNDMCTSHKHQQTYAHITSLYTLNTYIRRVQHVSNLQWSVFFSSLFCFCCCFNFALKIAVLLISLCEFTMFFCLITNAIKYRYYIIWFALCFIRLTTIHSILCINWQIKRICFVVFIFLSFFFVFLLLLCLFWCVSMNFYVRLLRCVFQCKHWLSCLNLYNSHPRFDINSTMRRSVVLVYCVYSLV